MVVGQGVWYVDGDVCWDWCAGVIGSLFRVLGGW